jgi:ABC-type multidrug transport system permease subunit
MGFAWSTAVKDLRRRRRDPLALLLWAGIPFGVLGLLLLAFGGGGNITPQARLLVVDLDESFLSRLLTGAFEQGPMAELVLLEQVTEQQGRERIGSGDGSALLVIPEGFGRAVLRSQPVTLELLTNPAQRILPGIVEETLSIFVDLVFYLQQLMGPELELIASESTDDLKTFALAALDSLRNAGDRVLDRLDGALNPPLLQLETTVVTEDSGPDVNFGALFFQGMFLLAIVFMAQGLSDDVWVERQEGTLRRALITPQTITAVLAGKLLAGVILFTGVSLLALTVGIGLYDFGFARLPLAVVWSAFTGLVLLALFTLLQLYAGSQRSGAILGNLVMFPLIMVGGNFFPFELMPDWLAGIGRLTPNGWALEQLKRILTGTATATGLSTAFASLAAVAGIAFVFGARRLRRRFAAS